MNLKGLRPALLLGVFSLGACTGDMDDLRAYSAEVTARQGGVIEPLPEIKSHPSFTYLAMPLRSPFTPDRPVDNGGPLVTGGIRPNDNRNREYLEQFPLDTLRMVGTLQLEGGLFALIQDSDGLIHRVTQGQYLGQNRGRILVISPSSVDLKEIVSDGLGGWVERPAAVALAD